MLISKFDLYNREWLAIVFKNRNQQYGAYELRQHYDSTLVRAMSVTFFIVAVFAITITIISHNKPIEAPAPLWREIPVDLSKKIFVAQHKEPQKAKQETKIPQKAPVRMQQYIAMKPAPEAIAQDPKKLLDNVPVGPVEIKVPGNTNMDNVPVELSTGAVNGGGGGNGVDNTPKEAAEVQVMPEPMGGAAAWAKFLQKNLRFPGAAQDQGVSGKVFLSFIIERDGHLSDITVIRKAGYGFDEEALRVLKLAPAWKPGMQNGQAVRVRYTIPINFQMMTD